MGKSARYSDAPPNDVNNMIINALKSSCDGVGVFDNTDTLVFCNNMMAKAFGLNAEQAKGMTFDDMVRSAFYSGSGIKIDSGDVEEFIKTARERRKERGFQSFESDLISGKTLLVSHMRNESDELFVYTSDISQLKETEHTLREALRQVKKLAATDPLTGIHNRRSFFHLAETEFARSKRYNHPLSVLALDIDHFKNINDTYGHQAGDKVLEAISHCCTSHLRTSDIFGRLGGEEFSILLPETELKPAIKTADRIRTAISELEVQIGEDTIQFTTSMGVADIRPEITSLEELMDLSDQALYQAKENGRNRVICWS